ncbi:hypothetical protein Q4S45_21415 [Massilia sp. R2A-15]|uniref:hypothetical protein n=1 Tax=Massilia sp. R2A-15 TaxID=3064278 RepID=UPI00273233FA|nr:hypothetical protein [Massilia sp. R2A-15]WLI89223.1 hypothetical protein Q4S45_21415 [Massilia sp. R2A-15]
MAHAQLPLIAELDLGDSEGSAASKAAAKFTGTTNPRHLRVIHALMIRPRRREEIDSISGASNGPDLMADLRALGLSAPCRVVPGIDRDGFPIRFGVYAFTSEDCRKITAWQRKLKRSAGSN